MTSLRCGRLSLFRLPPHSASAPPHLPPRTLSGAPAPAPCPAPAPAPAHVTPHIDLGPSMAGYKAAVGGLLAPHQWRQAVHGQWRFEPAGVRESHGGCAWVVTVEWGGELHQE